MPAKKSTDTQSKHRTRTNSKPASRKTSATSKKKPVKQQALGKKSSSRAPLASSPSYVEPLNIAYDRPAAKDRPKPRPIPHKHKPLHLKRYIQRWKKPAIIGLIIVVILGFAATPLSYPAWGAIVKHTITIRAVDKEFGLPIANPTLTLNGEPVYFERDGSDIHIYNVPTGNHTLLVGGDGYRPQSIGVSLGPTTSLGKEPSYQLVLEPTSRHLQLTITDAISRLPVYGAAATTAAGKATASDGKAVVLIPPDATTAKVTITADSYDTKEVTLEVQPGKSNYDYQLTPSGRAYYFSKSGSAADLYSVALDGTGTKIEVAASGTETVPPVAYRSPDLRWVAFTSDRNSPTLAKLFMFDTTTGSLQVVNDDYARFKIVGWTKQNTLIYTLERQTDTFQPANKYQIHRFNPADSSSRTVYSNRSLPTDTSKNYKLNQEGYVGIYEQLYADPIIHDTYITYVFRREAKPGYGHLLPPRSYIIIADLDGKTIRTVRENLGGYIYPVNLGNGKIGYVDYSSGERYYELDLATGKEEEKPAITKDPAVKYRSPDNTKMAWAEERNGTNTILVADTDGQNEKTVAIGFGLSINCWIGEKYLQLDSSNTQFTTQVVALSGGFPLTLATMTK